MFFSFFSLLDCIYSVGYLFQKMQRIKVLSKRPREEQDVASSSLNEVPKRTKKKRPVDRSGVDGDDRSATENIKTTFFFKQLHQTVANEVGVL